MRNILWKLRKKKQKFIEFVRLPISETEGERLTRKQIRKFAARARNYIAAYYILSGGSSNIGDLLTRITKVNIDKMRKCYRTYRSIE